MALLAMLKPARLRDGSTAKAPGQVLEYVALGMCSENPPILSSSPCS